MTTLPACPRPWRHLHHQSHFRQLSMLVLAAGALCGLPARAGDTTAALQLARFSAEAGAPASVDAGRAMFLPPKGNALSCASCHGTPPTGSGRHASTGKTIAPLAPAVNPQAFTDSAKVDKWLRRNCKDVLQRECSAGEKADVLAYLVSLKP